MTTNNYDKEPELDTADFGGAPDAAVLEALALSYFPELNSAPQGYPVFEKEITQYKPEVNPFGQAASVGELESFSRAVFDDTVKYSFLEDARNAFGITDFAKKTEPPKIPADLGITGFGKPDMGFGYPAFAPLLGPVETTDTAAGFDVNAIRGDFPILAEKVDGKNLIWFDNAATTHKPQSVIDRLAYFYAHENSNVHRGAHTLAARSTDAYENARGKVARFLNAPSANEIVFVRGTTEAINLIAHSYVKQFLKPDDEIIVSHLEHHANIVPWQIICSETGAKLRVIPVDSNGQLLLEELEKLLGPRTKFISVTQVSNALGTVVPVASVIQAAHRRGVKVLVDGAQAVSHMAVDVQALDADFYVFSGHKIYGPTGIGAIYAKPEHLQAMQPYQGGGNMIADVTFEHTQYQPPPQRFEAGTGNIADAVGLGAALDYVSAIGMHNISTYEHYILQYATEALRKIPGITFVGTAKEKASVLSFVLDGYTTEEVGEALSREGIAVRAGHHCAQPILRRLGLESTVRPSFAFYNTTEEVDMLAEVLKSLSCRGKYR